MMCDCQSERTVQDLENVQIAKLSAYESLLDGVEGALKDLKSILEFIHKERTSPRGRIDAMTTNTQHILGNIINIRWDTATLSAKITQFENDVSGLQSLQFHLVNLTDELTKLRMEIYRHDEEK